MASNYSPNSDDVIEIIFKLRAANNLLWCDAIKRLHALDPSFFKEWQKKVRKIDKEIYDWNEKLLCD